MAGFDIRRWETQSTQMIDWLQANPDIDPDSLASDLFVGSLERGHLEAVALLMEEFDIRADAAIKWAIPEAVFQAFGFERLLAQYAQGAVVFTCFNAPGVVITIPTGTLVQTGEGIRFQTTTTATIGIGAFTSTPAAVQAVDAGTSGNVPANAVQRIVYAIPGVDGVTNPNQISGGAAAESDTARKVRFSKWLKTLVRGTLDSLEFAALNTGLLVAAKAVDPFLISPVPVGVPYAGLAWLFADDGFGTGTLSDSTMLAVRNAIYGYTVGGRKIPGWKAAGVRVDILPVTPVYVKLRASVTLDPASANRWGDIQAAMTSAATGYFQSLRIGEKVSYQNLVVILSQCDSGISEVDLYMWKEASARPAYGSSIIADDINPVDATTVLGIGNRAYQRTGTVVESNGDTVTYPEWLQA